MDLKFPELNTTDGNAAVSSNATSTRGKISEPKEIKFDSGVLVSATDILPSLFSESDILSSGPSEYESRSDMLRSQEFQEEDCSSSCKCEGVKNDQMESSTTTDSGIYTDMWDRVADSKEEQLSKHNSSKSMSKSYQNNSFSRTELAKRGILNSLLEQNEDGDTLLHAAIVEKDENIVEHLLQMIPTSSYLDVQNYDYYQTCLHLSVLMNHPHLTRLLFLAGARTDIEDINGDTALHLACQMNHLECVTALLLPLTAYEQKYTTFSYKPVLDWSTKYLNEFNYNGVPCLHLAAVHEDCRILNQLFTYGADINVRECKGGYTILHKAVESGNENLVSYILQHPAIDIYKKTYARQTAYELSSRHPMIRQLLLIEGSKSYVSSESAEYYGNEEYDSE